MKSIRRLYFRFFKRYRRFDLRFVRYSVADELMRQAIGKSEDQQWHISPEEDLNTVFGYVHIERRERITS